MIPTGHRTVLPRGFSSIWSLICSALAIAGRALVRLTTMGTSCLYLLSFNAPPKPRLGMFWVLSVVSCIRGPAVETNE